MTEVDLVSFYGDVNLGNYKLGNSDGTWGEEHKRFSGFVTHDDKRQVSGSSPSPGGEFDGDKRICTLAFSYAGPGEYLLVISDKVGGFKNYLIDVAEGK